MDVTVKAARDLLHRQTSIAGFRTPVRLLEYDKDISFDSYQRYCRLTGMPVSELLSKGQLRDGLTFCCGDKEYLVLYNAAISFDNPHGGGYSNNGKYGGGTPRIPRLRNRAGFKITEWGARYVPGDTQTRINFTLAHEIGHILLEHRDDCPDNEAEANRFAAELLMPEPVVAELSRRLWRGMLPPYQIAYFFGTSLRASTLRARDIACKPALDGYLYHELIEKYGRHLENCGVQVSN